MHDLYIPPGLPTAMRITNTRGGGGAASRALGSVSYRHPGRKPPLTAWFSTFSGSSSSFQRRSAPGS